MYAKEELTRCNHFGTAHIVTTQSQKHTEYTSNSYPLFITILQPITLRDTGFTMSRLIAGLTSATQNAEAVYNYLRVMSSHKLDPTVVPIPQFLLEEIQEDIKGNLRLTLPIDPTSDKVAGYYNIIWVIPQIINDLLAVLVCPCDHSVNWRIHEHNSLSGLQLTSSPP